MGWATYNGDHMSMYGVNASVPKDPGAPSGALLCGHLRRGGTDSGFFWMCWTRRSAPELLPPKEGKIAQKTEELVGPYELHDFFLYYLLRYGCAPGKIFRLALRAFDGVYDRRTILKWLRKSFYRRFFAQQFKRSCLPDGPKVGTVALSPRGDLRMPSDAVGSIWQEELKALEETLNSEE